MKLYNTLTRKVEDFKSIKPNSVSLYSCGPTVYHDQHIGNFRKFVFDDTLRRTLAASGYEVKHVMNITDVGHLTSDADEGEDKLEKGARREGKTVWDTANHYTAEFKKDIERLNILTPNGYHGKQDNYARATDFIDEQIAMVKVLLDKGYAYQTERAIYFDVTKLPSYGELTGQKLDDKETAARAEVVTDPHKHHPQDFAVWFFTVGHFKDHSMRWPTPWGDGFPGWHLECSAIIHTTLDDPIDIHTGGVDNIGTHHVNEMAQTEAVYGHRLAKYWVHSEHLLVDGQKMSKSLGSIYTIGHLIEKGFKPLALRLLFLQTHYRTQMNFTFASIEAAQTFLQKIYAWADLKFQENAKNTSNLAQTYEASLTSMVKSLEDDLNSGEALSWLAGLLNASEDHGIDKKNFQATLDKLDELFGLELANRSDISDPEKSLIKKREGARKDENWQESDKLRDELEKHSIAVMDTANGTIWSRI